MWKHGGIIFVIFLLQIRPEWIQRINRRVQGVGQFQVQVNFPIFLHSIIF